MSRSLDLPGSVPLPLSLARFASIVLVALLTGLALAHVLEQPAKMHYDAALYITLQKSLYVDWGPPNLGGVLEPAAILATGLLAFVVRKNRRGFWFSLGALIALLLAFPVVFFGWVAPANAVFAAATLPNIPPGWSTARSNWELGHAIRFGLQLTALAMLVLSLTLDATAARGDHRQA